MKSWKIGQDILLMYATRYKQATRKAQRGEVLREFMEFTGIKTRATAIKKLRAVTAGNRQISDIAEGPRTRKSRKSSAILIREKEEAMKIASVKTLPGEKAKYGVSTTMAVEMLQSAGQLTLDYSVSQWNRILKKHGLEFKAFARTPMAHRLEAEHANHVCVVDATPMEHYFMDLRGKIVPFDYPAGDTHLDDDLQKRGLAKVWTFAAIDMYSKAFFIRPFAEPALPGRRVFGERAEVWLKFLQWLWLPKQKSPLEGYKAPLADSPVYGLPKILFCDKGSGIGGSTAVHTFCDVLGVEVRTHLPGHPNAKGIIESNLGTFKKSVEVGLNRHVIQSIDQLLYFYWSHVSTRNKKRGFYDRFHKSSLEYPLRLVTEDDYRNAIAPMTTRVITGFGTVSIDNEEWFVTADERFKGQRVNIFRSRSVHGETSYTAEYIHNDSATRLTFNLERGARSHSFDEIKSFPQTDGQLNRIIVSRIAKDVQRTISFDDTLPEEYRSGAAAENITRIAPPGSQLDSVGAIAPESFKTIEKARLWLLTRTGLLDGEMEMLDPDLPDLIDTHFNKTFETLGHIPGSLVSHFANIINEQKYKNYQQQIGAERE